MARAPQTIAEDGHVIGFNVVEETQEDGTVENKLEPVLGYKKVEITYPPTRRERRAQERVNRKFRL